MPIKLQCQCGKVLRLPDDAVGRRGRCPACGNVFVVPAAVEAEAVPVQANPVASSSDEIGFADDAQADAAVAVQRAAALRRREMAASAQQSGVAPKSKPVVAIPVGSTGRPYRYLFLLLALLPLAWSTVHPGEKFNLRQRLEQTLDGHPENIEKYNALPDNASKQDFFATLPDNRLAGAILPYDTWMHWGFAAISAAGFFGLILVLFPPGHTKISTLLIVGAITGTGGIVLLLAFQWIAFHLQLIVPRGIVGLLIDLVALIGWSYRLALDPHNGFVLSALGFTAGVGFCEETCKALPLIFKARSPNGFKTWRSAMIWGLISGVGFGVSEGITYSHDSYNGITGGSIYLIRFISCVALHGIWAAATGIMIFRRQDHFTIHMQVMDWLQQVAIVVIVPMILHGMYDTLLKQDYQWGALAIALASFGWLAYQIELAKRRMDHLPVGYAA